MKNILIFSAMIAAVSSNASLYDVKFLGTGAGKSVGITINGSNKTVFAGKLNFKKNPSGPSFQTVCADLGVSISGGAVYGVTSSFSNVGTTAVKKAGNIVGASFNSANSNDDAAALQLAVWEALYDGASAPSFSSGNFKTSASSSVKTKATAYYAKISQAGNALYLKATPTGSGQSQLTAVPEPAALASLGLGLALIIRRKARKA
ncbi:MAG: PEP-CTERM sorting domain-containing protein [Armatimonadetes bacterium]|nr:PEP-CTERM sorting domain-containing protein [Armatimonadota bacterium]